MAKQISILYTTIDSQSEAEKLAHEAVLHKHAACVNIIPNIISIYAWQHQVEKSSEYLMIFKTSADKLAILKSWLQKNHPYTTPAIYSIYAAATEKFQHYINRSMRFGNLVQPKKSLWDYIKNIKK